MARPLSRSRLVASMVLVASLLASGALASIPQAQPRCVSLVGGDCSTLDPLSGLGSPSLRTLLTDLDPAWLPADVVLEQPEPVADRPFSLGLDGYRLPTEYRLFPRPPPRRLVLPEALPQAEVHVGGIDLGDWPQVPENRRFSLDFAVGHSEDPLGDVDSPNLYQYGLSSPFNYTDPSGHSVVGKVVKKLARPAIRHKVKKTVFNRMGRQLRERGISKLYRKHHIIGQEFAGRYMTFFDDIGFDVDTRRNLMLLPSKLGRRTGAAGSRRAVHSGRHLGEYVGKVESRLADLQRRYRTGALGKQDVLDELHAFQAELRRGLKSGEIVLQKEDLDRLATGALVIPILGMSLVSEKAVEASVSSDLDAIVDESLERERQKNAYVKYGTAGHYTDSFVGTAIDFFNPVADVIDITDLIEDLYDIAVDKYPDESALPSADSETGEVPP